MSSEHRKMLLIFTANGTNRHHFVEEAPYYRADSLFPAFDPASMDKKPRCNVTAACF